MSLPWRRGLRGLVIVGGAAVILAGILEFRLDDWPIYVVFFLVSVLAAFPYVEVLPGLGLLLPDWAVTIGFLYIGGLPIIAIRSIAQVLIHFLHSLLRRLLPERWQRQLPPQPTGPTGIYRRELFAEWGMFSIGLATRWWIASALVGQKLPAISPDAIACAELGGYASWGSLSILPIYPDRPLLPLSSGKGLRTTLADIALIVVFALTPFVFLIAYGFRAHGLSGAAAWSLSTFGLHFMLKRMNERRLKLEEQNRHLEDLNRQLEHRERLSAIGKVSSMISHQMLQQLGVIGLYADLIRNADEESDPKGVLVQVRKNAMAIEGALRDMNRVMTDLLVFSRDPRCNLYQQSLRHVVEECLEDCRAQAANRNVLLRLECGAEIDVMLDKLKIKQALVNVLRNAIEASPAGSEVVMRTRVRDGWVEVAISDSGPGVAEQYREAAFAPFFTTKEHGTGLGLAIAREFTQAHGGWLWAEANAASSGATFVFRLPLKKALS